MAGAEALRAAALFAILALAACGLLSLPWLAVLGFLGAAGTVAYNVAAPSLIPALVPAGALAAANGRIELARTAAFAAGPALGGALIGWTGATPAFALAATLSLGAVVLLTGLREPPRPALPPRNLAQDLRHGAGFVLGHRLLRPILFTAVFFNTAFFVLQAAYVPYAVERLGLSASTIGITLGAYGVGMVLGALMAAQAARRFAFGTVIAIGPVAGFMGALAMLLTIWLPSPLLAGLCFFLLGAGPVIWVISTTTLRQVVTPNELLGRASAVISTATYGARPIGAALGGLVGAAFGLEWSLLAAALGFLIQATVILASPAVRLRALPARSQNLSVSSTVSC